MAQVDLKKAEHARMLNDLKQIIGWVEKLQKLDTTGIAPLLTISPEENRLSEDTPAPPLAPASLFANAPDHDQAYFHLPTQKE